MFLLVVAVGTAGALTPSIPELPPIKGYNGCFDGWSGHQRSQSSRGCGQGCVLTARHRTEESIMVFKNHEHGGRPKYLHHWTKKKDAKNMAKVRHILASKKSEGDASLGKVYMTAIPQWATRTGQEKQLWWGNEQVQQMA